LNETLALIHNRRSIRAFEEREVSPEIKAELLHATLRAPTAGNLMLYSIIDVQEQHIKDTLAVTCDNQPFIARAPLVWVFLADYQRWYDCFRLADISTKPDELKPQEADLLLACCDALAAAQTAVIAAESLGLGSCYIGDIMERYEVHRELFGLPRYTFPICMLCLGYPTSQRQRKLTSRFEERFIIFQNQYQRLGPDDFQAMFASESQAGDETNASGFQQAARLVYKRKFNADFSAEMRRSVKAMLRYWSEA